MTGMKIETMESPLFNGSQKTASQLPLPEDIEAFAQAMKTSSNDTLGAIVQQQGKTATDIRQPSASQSQNVSGKGAEPASIQERPQEVSPSLIPGQESNLSRTTASNPFENTRQTQNPEQTVSARTEAPVNNPSEKLVVSTETQQQGKAATGVSPALTSQQQNVSGKGAEAAPIQARPQEVSPSLMPGRESDISQTTASRPFENTRQTQNLGETISVRMNAPENKSSERLVVSTETQQQGKVSMEGPAVGEGIQQQGKTATDVSPALTSQPQNLSGKGAEAVSIQARTQEESPSLMPGRESDISRTTAPNPFENTRQTQNPGHTVSARMDDPVNKPSERLVVSTETQQQGKTAAGMAPPTIGQQQFSSERPVGGAEIQQQGKPATDVSPALTSLSQMEEVSSAVNIQQQTSTEKVFADNILHPDKKGLQLDGERLLQAMDREEKRETPKHKESSLPPITGPLDGLLGARMEGKTEASEKVAPTLNSHTVNEIAQKCVERILVSRPENGASEVRLQMGHDILPDTEIRLSRGVDGQLTVSMYTDNETSFQSMVAMRNDLLDNLQHQEKDTAVRVEISFQNNAENGDMNRRSRGYVQQQDDTQQTG